MLGGQAGGQTATRHLPSKEETRRKSMTYSGFGNNGDGTRIRNHRIDSPARYRCGAERSTRDLPKSINGWGALSSEDMQHPLIDLNPLVPSPESAEPNGGERSHALPDPVLPRRLSRFVARAPTSRCSAASAHRSRGELLNGSEGHIEAVIRCSTMIAPRQRALKLKRLSPFRAATEFPEKSPDGRPQKAPHRWPVERPTDCFVSFGS